MQTVRPGPFASAPKQKMRRSSARLASVRSWPTHPVRYKKYRMKFQTIQNWCEIVGNLH
jgi:hypothetical protein